jgi:hypothetical protein
MPMNNWLDIILWMSVGSSATFVFCTIVTRSDYREWSQLTDRLIALIEKQQAESGDADWWKSSNEENESDEQ